jgi:hypothetical protein
VKDTTEGPIHWESRVPCVYDPIRNRLHVFIFRCRDNIQLGHNIQYISQQRATVLLKSFWFLELNPTKLQGNRLCHNQIWRAIFIGEYTRLRYIIDKFGIENCWASAEAVEDYDWRNAERFRL